MQINAGIVILLSMLAGVGLLEIVTAFIPA